MTKARRFDRCDSCNAPIPRKPRDAVDVAWALERKPGDWPDELWISAIVPVLCDECEEDDRDCDDAEWHRRAAE